MKSMARVLSLAIFLASTASAQQPVPPRRGFSPADPNARVIDAGPRASSATPIDLSGAWRGVYCADDTVVVADLELTTDAAKRTLTGELRMTTIPSALMRGTAAQPFKGSSAVTGVVDPGSRTVVLSAAAGVRPPMPGILPPSASTKQMKLNAVMSVGRTQFAGQFEGQNGSQPGQPYFVFARADAATKLEDLAKHAAALGGALKASGSPPSDAELAKWSARYVEEYGQAGLGTSVDRISAMALPLLNDATFKPLFGERYDALDFGKLAAAMQRGGGVVSGGSRADPQFVREHLYIQYMLWPSAPKLVSVAAMRVIDAWKTELLAHFQNDPPVASAFDDLAAAQKALKERVEYAWPSEKKATDETIERIRPRMSGSALAANVDRAVSDAAGRAGAEALASWAKTNEALLATCAQAERDAAQKRIDTKLDALLEPLLAESLAQLEKLGSGPTAVRDGAAWYRALLTQFAFAAQRPPVVRATEKLAGRREQDIAAGQRSYADAIAAAQTTDDIDRLFATDLSVPGDPSTPSFAPLAAIARERKRVLQEAILMSLFSADEKQYMDRPGHIDLSKYDGAPPSPESARLALLRGYASLSGTLLDAHTARCVSRQFSPMLLPFSAVISMSNERFTNEPVEVRSTENEDEYGWRCTYTLTMQMTIPQDNVLASYDSVVRQGVDQEMKLVNGLLQAFANTPSTAVFELYEDGWGVPGMRAIGGAESALGALLGSH